MWYAGCAGGETLVGTPCMVAPKSGVAEAEQNREACDLFHGVAEDIG